MVREDVRVGRDHLALAELAPDILRAVARERFDIIAIRPIKAFGVVGRIYHWIPPGVPAARAVAPAPGPFAARQPLSDWSSVHTTCTYRTKKLLHMCNYYTDET